MPQQNITKQTNVSAEPIPQFQISSQSQLVGMGETILLGGWLGNLIIYPTQMAELLKMQKTLFVDMFLWVTKSERLY